MEVAPSKENPPSHSLSSTSIPIKHSLKSSPKFKNGPQTSSKPTITIKAWRKWMTGRRLFYLVIILMCAITIILFIVAAALNSSAINTMNKVTPVSPDFTQGSPYVTGPALLAQGATLLSSDYIYAMVFTDDLYLINAENRKILWSADSNAVGPLAVFPTNAASSNPSYGTLQLGNNGVLAIFDGFGALRWSNGVSGTVDVLNPYVLIVTPSGSLQIQTEDTALQQKYSVYLWEVNVNSTITIPVFSSLQSPFTFAPLSFILQSENKQYYGEFESNGVFSIYNYLEPTLPIYQTTKNSLIPSSKSYSLSFRMWGELTIVNDCFLTVWSSQTGIFGQKYDNTTFSLLINNAGKLQINSNNSNLPIPLWTSDTVYTYGTPPYSWSSPTPPLTAWSVQSADFTLRMQFNSNPNDPATTYGALLLYYLQNEAVNLSNTDNRGQTLTIDNNGSLSIQDQKGQTIFIIRSPIENSTCYNSDFATPYIIVAVTDSQNQLQAYDQLNLLPQWGAPIRLPANLPTTITANPQPITTIAVDKVFYIMQSNISAPSFALRVDNTEGTIAVQNLNTGLVANNQVFHFIANDTLAIYFSLSALINIVGLENKNISKWNSGTGEFNGGFSSNPVMTLDDKTGDWVIQIGSQIIWTATIAVSTLRPLSSVSSILNVSPNNSLNLSQSVNLPELHLISQNSLYHAIFPTDGGSLTLQDQNQNILWSSQTVGANILVLNEIGNLIILQGSQIRASFVSNIQSQNLATQLPVTLSVDNSANLILTAQDGTTLWKINSDTKFNFQLASPQIWTNSFSLFLLISTDNAYSLFYANGVFSVVSATQNQTVWSSPLPDTATTPPYTAVFRNVGDILVYDSADINLSGTSGPNIIWSTNSANFYDPEPPYYLTLDVSGILSISSAQVVICNTSTPTIWSNNVNSIPLSTLSTQLLSQSQWIISNPSREKSIQLTGSPNCTEPIFSLTTLPPTTELKTLSSSLLDSPAGYYLSSQLEKLLAYYPNGVSQTPSCILVSASTSTGIMNNEDVILRL